MIGGTEKILEHSRIAFRIDCNWGREQSTEVMIKDTITQRSVVLNAASP